VLTDRDIYFVSNRSDTTTTDTCTFRDGSYRAELWNPLTGEIKQLRSIILNSNGYHINLKMEPRQSYFIVFYHLREFQGKGRETGNNFSEKRTVYTLKAPWRVRFDREMGGPDLVTFDTLADWSVNSEPGIKYYSGIADYSCNFDLPDSVSSAKDGEFYLDLGDVENMAKVRLNGKELGIVWCFPFRVKINDGLKKKNNLIEISVANLWVNRLIGDEQKPWDGIENSNWPDWLIKGLPRTSGRYTFTTHHFYTKDDQLVPSGLKGPVRLLRSAK
jgi:hypothetical protein